MIAQRDSRVMTDLGEAARQDSRAMRTIAVVTLAFLPPTLLSVRNSFVMRRTLIQGMAGNLQHELLRLYTRAKRPRAGVDSFHQVLDILGLRNTADLLDSRDMDFAAEATWSRQQRQKGYTMVQQA